MIKSIVVIALTGALGFSQTLDTRLKGKRIYMHKNDGGHQNGYDGLRDLLIANKAAYGYEFEFTGPSLGFPALDSLFNRLYKGPNEPRQANTIDILIFCQGEGDGNMGRVDMNHAPSAAAMMARHRNVNTHVRSGGSLIMVHAAAGREVSWYRWHYGAKLMTEWFLDGCNASSSFPGNSGHFSANTLATAVLDDETLQPRDPSLYFIRNLLTMPKEKGGFGQPAVNSAVKGEWYHFNGGFKYEDGSGGPVANVRNTYPIKSVRGNPGEPDSGIGPAKVITSLTRIAANYVPPGKGRPIAWGREVSWGAFDPQATAKNGRFFYINTGHGGDEWTVAGNWMGDLFLSTLRWSVKDEIGCMNPSDPGYRPWFTVNSCQPTVVRKGEALASAGSGILGGVIAEGSALEIALEKDVAHVVKVLNLEGRTLFRRKGLGISTYRVPGLEPGSYLVVLEADGKTIRKSLAVGP